MSIRPSSTSISLFRRSPLGLAAALALTGAAFAQQAPAAKADDKAKADVNTLETVTVTARRREETLKDVPVAVTALSAEALETKDIKNLGDLQSQVPNLSIYAARGSNTTITTYIRGVGQSDPLWGVDPGVGIYFDDVFIARPQGALLDVYDVQRIEVLRGPQGTLYGKNTIGGAIKYVSKPLQDSNGGSIGVTVGNYGQLNLKGALNLSSDDGQLRGRVALASLQRDGYGKNLADGSDVSNQDTQAGRVSLGFFPKGLPMSVQISADETRDKSNMRGFQRLIANPNDPAKTPPYESRYDINSGMANQNHTTAKGNSITATWNLNESWTAKFISAQRQSETETGIDFDGLPNKIADVRAAYSDKSRSNEVQLTYDGNNNNGVFGLYTFDGNAGGRVRNNFFNLLFGDTNGRVYTKSEAAYADWSFKISPRLGASAGVRYTQESKHAIVLNRSYSNDQFTTITATSADFDKTRKVSNTAPKIGVDYKLSDSTNLYATASRGFKSGGYNVRANTAAVPDSAKPFADEILDSLELGSKMSLDGGRFEMNTALFSNNYKNVQLSVFTSYTLANGTQGFFGDFTNAGKATVRGIEIEFAWRPDSIWTVSGNVAGVDAKYKEYMDRGVNVAANKWFSNTPSFSGALNIEAKSAAPFGGVLRTRLGMSYRSKVYPTTDLSEAIAQDGYALLNAGVVWERDKHWSFSLQGNNLTNQVYRTDGYNIASLGVLSGFYGAPRTVSASATYKF
ncbi:TonB-dependent receptor [Pelomonas sp. SE-A7]|uniref:TonB-dependent receptor n=1 Tax=Pelomonas sp. SE-A7 TaxID=3054953 RepID=UPI00259C8F8F|nr:TonB-dependent receptor [Pelomonas sp. SE-A7]MDM4766611.1 TonB-dependent receptor [Pelomonas sp. SE-A7]